MEMNSPQHVSTESNGQLAETFRPYRFHSQSRHPNLIFIPHESSFIGNGTLIHNSVLALSSFV